MLHLLIETLQVGKTHYFGNTKCKYTMQQMQWQLIIMHRMHGKVTKPSAQPCKPNLQNVHNELGATKHRYGTHTHVQIKFAQTKKQQKNASQSD